MQDKLKSYTEVRPWGSFVKFVDNEKVTVKIITVEAGQELSLQKHKKRDEFWKVLKGNPTVTIGKDVSEAKEKEEFFVSKGTFHRIGAKDKGAEILEISFGEFDENDIQRSQDRYGRSD